jgi:hypothetical protein
MFVLMLLSILLLPVMEVEAVKAEGVYYGDRIFGELAVALRASAWAPLLLAFGFASGFPALLAGPGRLPAVGSGGAERSPWAVAGGEIAAD